MGKPNLARFIAYPHRIVPDVKKTGQAVAAGRHCAILWTCIENVIPARRLQNLSEQSTDKFEIIGKLGRKSTSSVGRRHLGMVAIERSKMHLPDGRQQLRATEQARRIGGRG